MTALALSSRNVEFAGALQYLVKLILAGQYLFNYRRVLTLEGALGATRPPLAETHSLSYLYKFINVN